MMMGYDYDYQETKLGAQDLSLAAHLHPDPVVLELNRLQNQLKEKDRELGAAQGEIKGLRANEALKDKAIEELRAEANKLDEKLRANENLLEQKNLDIKRLRSERRDALAAQYAAESTLRRVYTDQKDEDSLPLDSILAPLEAEIKMYKNEITALQEDKKALERLTKSKESALLEAERILRSALERALIVEEVQNQNYELRRQIEICQEENKILEKTNRQKVLEVEKLSETIKELEEAVLAGGAAANIIRDHRRQISELQEEKRTLERELARVKVSAGRIANVVANEWKDENDKVMPVRQWLEERRLLQAEMQRLKDKLAISERTAKAEAQLKDKLKLRLKTLEEGLKQASSFAGNGQKTEKSGNIFGFLNTSNGLKKRSTSQPRGASINGSSLLQQPNIKSGKLNGENVLKKGIWAYRNKVADSGGKENAEAKANADTDTTISNEIKSKSEENEVSQITGNGHQDSDDVISGFLYDRLQKEVISLRKLCEAKDGNLNAKDQEIKMLMKKVDALMKAIEVESKKIKREAAAREKEAALLGKLDDTKKTTSLNSSRSSSRIARAT